MAAAVGYGACVSPSAVGKPREVLPVLDEALAWLGRPCATLDIGLPPGFKRGAFGMCLSGGTFVLIELAMLLVLECLPKLSSKFVARKVCHSGTGLLMLTLDQTTPAARAAVWVIGGSSLLMTWDVTRFVGIKPFRFGAVKDIGITIYLVLVMCWYFVQLPTAALSVMFFADPSGAVLGKALTRSGWRNPAWYEKKTVGGSLAVCIVTAVTLIAFYPPLTVGRIAVLSLAAAVAEAVGGAYDNLVLAAVVIGGFILFAQI